MKMAAVDPIAEIAAADKQALAPTSADALQNRFLTLLLTQLQNQDPTNPMKNEEITSQMAQLSTVSGISSLNEKIEGLLTGLQSSQSMQAANLIGKHVVVPGDAITLNNGAGKFGVLLEAPADVEIVIKNADGVAVRTINLENQPAGVSSIPWDGKNDKGETVADGDYTFTMTAKNGAAEVASMSLSIGLVESVTTSVLGGGGAILNIPNIGPVNFANVLQILGKENMPTDDA